MRTEFLPFSPPCIGPAERAEVHDTLNSKWITTGPKTKAFEEKLRQWTNAPAVVALNSCTAGLHVSLLALGVGPGDEVLVPTMTFCATANVVEHVGAKPVLVDVCPDTLNMDPEAAAAAITPRTKVIMPVHYAGHPVDMDAIFSLADAHQLQVVEDAAHALPARYKGQLIGSRKNLAAYSFYATKNLSTVEGGAVTGDPALVERCRILGHHGMNRDAWKRFDKSGSWYYEIVLPGFKYNMTDVQASIGLHQLDRMDGFQARRREVVNAYREGFQDITAVEIPTERPEVDSSLHLYVLRLHLEQLNIDRNKFIEEMTKRNIGTSVHYLPVHMHPFYRDKYGFRPDSFPVAAQNYTRMISLPLHPALSDQEVADVIEAVRDIIRLNRA